MSKYINRLRARLAREAMGEGTKNWYVTKRLILETDEGDLEFNAGDEIEIGGDENGDLAIGTNSAAVVVIADEELARKVADVVASADELSDVDFVEKPALDSVLDGEEMDDVVDKLADDEDANVEVAELEVSDEVPAEEKFESFAESVVKGRNKLLCEAIRVDEEASNRLNMNVFKRNFVAKESFNAYNEFTKRISEMKGSIQPGEREIALTESGKVMGAWNKADDKGFLFLENEFEDEEGMDNFDDAPADIMDAGDIEFEDMDAVEESLKAYEESAKSGKDYMTLVESLSDEKLGLKEEVVAKIVATFDNKSLKECVRAFDSKYGKYVAAFKESVEADNFIAETGAEKRFTKRFFA